MPSISVKQLNDATWREVYKYDYNDKGAGFRTFACDAISDITVTHDRKIGASRTIIYYTIAGRKTDSPSVAVQWWNTQHGSKKDKPAGKPRGRGAQPA